MGKAQRRRDLRHLVTRILSMRPWSLRSPDTKLEAKSKDSSTWFWEINQTTFQHFTCIHFSSKSLYRRSLRGRRGRLSPFSLLCSVRAPVAYSIGDLGGFHGRILQRGAFSTRDIPVVTIGFLSFLLALRTDVCRGLSATAHFLLLPLFITFVACYWHLGNFILGVSILKFSI